MILSVRICPKYFILYWFSSAIPKTFRWLAYTFFLSIFLLSDCSRKHILYYYRLYSYQKLRKQNINSIYSYSISIAKSKSKDFENSLTSVPCIAYHADAAHSWDDSNQSQVTPDGRIPLYWPWHLCLLVPWVIELTRVVDFQQRILSFRNLFLFYLP